MPDKVLKDIQERLEKAKENGQEYFGKAIFNIANNKIISVEITLEIKEHKKITLA